jgi:predicted CXXCH cytochrome family protein
MKARTAAAGILALAIAQASCSASTRHRVLTRFFDGVPPLPSESSQEGPGAPAAAEAPRAGLGSDHGPYAAKMCGACHESATMNALVAPRDELCLRCHTLPLDVTYVHGPLASGGCLVCHDPHNSRYPALLVSDADGFCVHCHDPKAVAAVQAHQDLEPGTTCTTCHDAHGSDKPFLLK